MTHDSATAENYAPPALPAVRKITFADLNDALVKGWEDFRQKPSPTFCFLVSSIRSSVFSWRG